MKAKVDVSHYKLNEVEELLSKGADERIAVDKLGNTKYSIPLFHANFINRGSCTCSVASSEDLDLMERVLEKTKTERDWIDLIDHLSDELKNTLSVRDDDNMELFFAPSGTDLVYYPIMFSKLLHPTKKILNITTCIEELGSGSKFAGVAQYYADYNQFGESIDKGKYIEGFEDVKGAFFNARSEDGEILNNRDEILSLIKDHEDHVIIINLVYGSKSGIEDSIELIDEIKGDNIFWNTDFCQFRHSNTVINKLIEKNSTVMITGSKFYQAPPFCAAMLVPKQLYNKLTAVDNWDVIIGFYSIFSAFDFPCELREKTNFRKTINHSVILKWMCAVAEMEKYGALDQRSIQQVIKRWRKTLTNYLAGKEAFELMPFQENANKTILSFRVLKDGKYLNNNELKELHEYTVLSDYPFLSDDAKVFIGQPVNYHEDKSFIRLAIGSKNIRRLIADDEHDFELDKNIIDAIAYNIEKYNEDHERNS